MPVLRSISQAGKLVLAYGGGMLVLTAISTRLCPQTWPAKQATPLVRDDRLTEGEKHALRLRILAMACDED